MQLCSQTRSKRSASTFVANKSCTAAGQRAAGPELPPQSPAGLLSARPCAAPQENASCQQEDVLQERAVPPLTKICFKRKIEGVGGSFP